VKGGGDHLKYGGTSPKKGVSEKKKGACRIKKTMETGDKDGPPPGPERKGEKENR